MFKIFFSVAHRYICLCCECFAIQFKVSDLELKLVSLVASEAEQMTNLRSCFPDYTWSLFISVKEQLT